MPKAKEFARRLSVLGKRVENTTENLKRKSAILILQNLTISTPVDTGAARSNWLVEVQGFNRSIVVPVEIQSTLTAGRIKIDESQKDEFIAVSNNLPYIGTLNNGSSAQAPAGFVESSILQAVSGVQGVKLLT